MSKTIYSLAVALVLGTTAALASPGDDGCIGNCPNNGGGSGGPTTIDVAQGQQQGQLQGQAQESYNANTNTNSNSSEANAASNSSSTSDSSATGIGFGGSSTVGVAVKTGPTSSRSVSNAEGGKGGDGGNANASGGDAYASGGDSRAYSEGSVAGSSVGDVTSSSGPSNSSSNSGGNSQSLGISIKGDSVVYEDSASRAASVYSQVCQNGGSAQAKAGGFSIVNQDVVCEHLKVAAVMREAYLWEIHHGSANCVETMAGPKMDNGVVYSDVCFNEKAVEYYKAYHEHMTEALQAMEAYEEVGLLDKISGALVRPMALIGALIWLI